MSLIHLEDSILHKNLAPDFIKLHKKDTFCVTFHHLKQYYFIHLSLISYRMLLFVFFPFVSISVYVFVCFSSFMSYIYVNRSSLVSKTLVWNKFLIDEYIFLIFNTHATSRKQVDLHCKSINYISIRLFYSRTYSSLISIIRKGQTCSKRS